METEREDREQKAIQTAENMDTVCNEWPPQSTADKTKEKGELNHQVQKQENISKWGSAENQTGYVILGTLWD